MIPLNVHQLDLLNRSQIDEAIRAIVRNVRFEFLEPARAIRLLGPDMYYHAFDPYLPSVLRRFDSRMTVNDILSYRLPGSLFDLCFEDCWSGYFISEHLRFSRQKDDLIILHLDDHTDMMSTLLERSEEDLLVDPMTGRRFEPEAPAAWKAAIHSGSVSIGCFVTPFYFGIRRTHIWHLNNAAGDVPRFHGVVRKPVSYDLIPEKRFAAIELTDANEPTKVGSYMVSSSAEELVDDLPRGQVIVHVDLDYLINDFNGNPRTGPYVPAAGLVEDGRLKLDRFFKALQTRRVKVDRWIIATSPGFCSACHWPWLLEEFTKRIESYRVANVGR